MPCSGGRSRIGPSTACRTRCIASGALTAATAREHGDVRGAGDGARQGDAGEPQRGRRIRQRQVRRVDADPAAGRLRTRRRERAQAGVGLEADDPDLRVGRQPPGRSDAACPQAVLDARQRLLGQWHRFGRDHDERPPFGQPKHVGHLPDGHRRRSRDTSSGWSAGRALRKGWTGRTARTRAGRRPGKRRDRCPAQHSWWKNCRSMYPSASPRAHPVRAPNQALTQFGGAAVCEGLEQRLSLIRRESGDVDQRPHVRDARPGSSRRSPLM